MCIFGNILDGLDTLLPPNLHSWSVSKSIKEEDCDQSNRNKEETKEKKNTKTNSLRSWTAPLVVFVCLGGGGVWFTQSASRRRLCGFGGWTVMWFCGGKCWLVGVLKQEVSWSCCLRWRHSARSRYINRNVEMSLDCTLTRCQVLAGLFFFLHLMFGFFLFFKCFVLNKAKWFLDFQSLMCVHVPSSNNSRGEFKARIIKNLRLLQGKRSNSLSEEHKRMFHLFSMWLHVSCWVYWKPVPFHLMGTYWINDHRNKSAIGIRTG